MSDTLSWVLLALLACVLAIGVSVALWYGVAHGHLPRPPTFAERLAMTKEEAKVFHHGVSEVRDWKHITPQHADRLRYHLARAQRALLDAEIAALSGNTRIAEARLREAQLILNLVEEQVPHVHR